MPKFICIKAVLFVTFWQSVVIAGLTHIQWIHAFGEFTTESVSRGLQDLLICVEMFAAALAHKCVATRVVRVRRPTHRDCLPLHPRYAFSHEPYKARGQGGSSLLRNMFAIGAHQLDMYLCALGWRGEGPGGGGRRLH